MTADLAFAIGGIIALCVGIWNSRKDKKMQTTLNADEKKVQNKRFLKSLKKIVAELDKRPDRKDQAKMVEMIIAYFDLGLYLNR